MNNPACGACKQATHARLCEWDRLGGACLACKKNKTKCEYTQPKPKEEAEAGVEMKPAAGNSQTQVKKEKTAPAPKARGSKWARAEVEVVKKEQEEEGVAADDEEVEMVEPPAKEKGKARESGPVQVKREPKPSQRAKPVHAGGSRTRLMIKMQKVRWLVRWRSPNPNGLGSGSVLLGTHPVSKSSL